jgi:hypothetical protein
MLFRLSGRVSSLNLMDTGSNLWKKRQTCSNKSACSSAYQMSRSSLTKTACFRRQEGTKDGRRSDSNEGESVRTVLTVLMNRSMAEIVHPPRNDRHTFGRSRRMHCYSNIVYKKNVRLDVSSSDWGVDSSDRNVLNHNRNTPSKPTHTRPL